MQRAAKHGKRLFLTRQGVTLVPPAANLRGSPRKQVRVLPAPVCPSVSNPNPGGYLSAGRDRL